MLTHDAMRSLIADMWRLHCNERFDLDELRAYARGEAGRPDIPQGVSNEVKDLARLAPKNVIGLVIESFAQNLSVIGYRSATADVNSPAWGRWQAQRMDARQAQVHRAALTYGASYVVVAPDPTAPGGHSFRPRSPRQLVAVYADPEQDEWPLYALETWTATTPNGKQIRRGLLFDETYVYPLDLGVVPVGGDITYAPMDVRGSTFGAPVEHGAPVCPVVRYVDRRDSEDVVTGEVAPLITAQRAINSVNFDRLIVSRFGAFPQRVISGWAPSSESEALHASARRVWTFGDPDVKATTLPGASVESYNAILAEMLEHVAMVAQISPAQVTGKMVNLSAEALAAGEAAQQRKLAAIRESFGESHESLLRLSAAMSGDAASAGDVESEILWRDTEARSFASVVDGVVKLAQVGLPIDGMLSLIPGLSQAEQVALAQGAQAQRERDERQAERDAQLAAQQAPQAPQAIAAPAAPPAD